MFIERFEFKSEVQLFQAPYLQRMPRPAASAVAKKKSHRRPVTVTTARLEH